MAVSKPSETQGDLSQNEGVVSVKKRSETLAFRALEMTRKEEKQRKKQTK